MNFDLKASQKAGVFAPGLDRLGKGQLQEQRTKMGSELGGNVVQKDVCQTYIYRQREPGGHALRGLLAALVQWKIQQTLWVGQSLLACCAGNCREHATCACARVLILR